MTKKQPKPAEARPNRGGIYPADTWRQSNPGYEKDAPKESRSGRVVEIDVTGWYDYERGLKVLGRG